MRQHWSPDVAFLSRRSKPQLIDIAQASGAAAYASAIATYKKSELVSALTRHFEDARAATQPNEHHQKALAWLPDAMRFPAVDPDAEMPEDAGDGVITDAAA